MSQEKDKLLRVEYHRVIVRFSLGALLVRREPTPTLNFTSNLISLPVIVFTDSIQLGRSLRLRIGRVDLVDDATSVTETPVDVVR